MNSSITVGVAIADDALRTEVIDALEASAVTRGRPLERTLRILAQRVDGAKVDVVIIALETDGEQRPSDADGFQDWAAGARLVVIAPGGPRTVLAQGARTWRGRLCRSGRTSEDARTNDPRRRRRTGLRAGRRPPGPQPPAALLPRAPGARDGRHGLQQRRDREPSLSGREHGQEPSLVRLPKARSPIESGGHRARARPERGCGRRAS